MALCSRSICVPFTCWHGPWQRRAGAGCGAYPRRLPCAPQPAPAHLCKHRDLLSPPPRLRAEMVSGLGESGGPWSEVQEETSAAHEPKAHGRPKAGEQARTQTVRWTVCAWRAPRAQALGMSGRGHPARPAQGTRIDSRRGPSERPQRAGSRLKQHNEAECVCWPTRAPDPRPWPRPRPRTALRTAAPAPPPARPRPAAGCGRSGPAR